jgi:hypothetical protein
MFVEPFALLGHLNELASADSVPTGICACVLAIDFLGDQPLLDRRTVAVECIRVFHAVGNPQAMGAFWLVGVVACMRIGTFDKADMAGVHKRPGSKRGNSHGLVIVLNRVECSIITVRMEALVLTGSCLLVKRDSHFKLPLTKKPICESTLEPVQHFMCRDIPAATDYGCTVTAVLGMEVQNGGNCHPPQNNLFMAPW